MNPTIQPGMHPDAESLTAFAEQVLPAAEREEILAHMSTCGRCREVVFLAQQAAEEDQPEPVAAAVDAPIKPRTSRFNWRWAWIPAAACAGLIGVAVMQHSRRAETETATNVAPTDALGRAGSPKAETQKQTTQNEPKPAKPSKQSDVVAEREIVPQTLRRDEEKSLLDAKKPSDQKDVGVRATVPAIVFAPGVSGGSTHGMAARAKTSAIGGPLAADQFQQQNMANQQNMLQRSQNAQLDAANKTVDEATVRQSESETVSVQAQPVIPTPRAVPAAPKQVNNNPITEENNAVSLAGVTKLSKKEKISLPDGLETLSVANGGGDRTIALDTKGALFVSEDGGKHWKPVRTQWTGHAVLVRSVNTAEKGNAVGALGALKMSTMVKFELVTDDLQTWLSADGNVWTLQAMPGK
jgi:hypothetical protein